MSTNESTVMRTPMDWLMDFQDCLEGGNGLDWSRRAEEWLEDNPDLPTDGTAWKQWRAFRWASPNPTS